ncbi:4-coumarate--CoA ligase 1 [Trichoplax sp. H2]|nr:4-coumarate--CoA ligase 1 [Trichoplax sp. H2]|eukprot:RDD39445.1 4-coumarate--CoA ligase 1 [Trichoplax sp. H2]
MEITSKYDCKLPDGISLIDYVFEYFDKYADREAVVDAASGRCYTYAQIRGLARKFASALTRRGLQKGDTVAVYSPNIPEYPIVFFGIIIAGGTITTCNPLYTPKELSHQLHLAEAKHIFTVNLFAEKAKEAAFLSKISNIYVLGSPTGDGITSFQELLADDGSYLKEVKFDVREDVAVLPFSSGTTGLPKGVMLTHYNIVSNLSQATVKGFFYVNEDDVMLALLPWFHIYGMVTILFAGLRSGTKIVSMARFEPKVFLETIQNYKITVAPIVPPIAVFLSKHPLVNSFDISSLKDVISAAAPLGKDTQYALTARLGVNVRQGYGMTELSPVVSISILGNSMAGSAGVLVPHTKAKTVDIETGKALPCGKSGELCFKGPQVMKGYLKNKAATDRTIDTDGWLHTGDIGYFDKEGDFFIVDRLKELIKYKGFQVPPAELEELLLTHPKIADVAVIGIPDIDAGELPKAFVVKRANDVTEEEVIAFVASEVSPHKKLRGGVEFIESIPKSASGKILRRQLKAQEIEKYKKVNSTRF